MIPTADLTTAWNLSSVVVDMGAGGDMATSIYDEICAAAEGTRRRLYEREQRCIGQMLTLVPGFVEYCKIPLDRVTLLRKEDDTGADGQYRESPDGKRYTLPGAIVYDEADDLWQLGVAISVSPVGTFPDRYFSFTVAVTESSGKAMVMTGLDEKQQALDFNQPGELGTYFESLATICNAKLSEASRKSSKSSQFGFALAS